MLFIMLCITSLTLNCGYSCRGHHNIEKKAKRIAHRITNKLNLNESQKASLMKMRDKFITQAKQHKVERKSNRERLAKALQEEKLNKTVLQDIFTKKQRGPQINAGCFDS